MGTVNVYSRATALTDVKGRINYATSPDKQENLLAVAGQTDPAFWERLATESQLAWRAAGGDKERACCEAREICDALPNSALQEDLQELGEKIAARFTEKYGAPCMVAIHLNKAKNNLHYHLIYSDRLLLAEPEIRIADRNVFLDEHGVRKRTKKEILDADGQIRDGCRIVPKGEVLSERHFGPKEDLFSSKGWLMDYKMDLADWINDELKPDKKRTVFDPAGPYLPQHKLKKGISEEKEAEIQKYNRAVQKYNGWVKDGIIEPEQASVIKGYVMMSPNRYEALAASLFPERGGAAMPGGERTKKDPTDPVEQKKQELRKLFRESRLAWDEYRRLPDGVDKKIALSRARGISAQIDETKRYLGMYTYEEYMALLDKEEADLRKKQNWMMRCRSQAHSYAYRWDRCEKRIEYLYRELGQIPILFPTEEQKAERRRICAEIEEAREDQRRYAHEEWLARQKYKEAKKEARELRKKTRETRREARQQQKKEKAAAQVHDRPKGR